MAIATTTTMTDGRRLDRGGRSFVAWVGGAGSVSVRAPGVGMSIRTLRFDDYEAPSRTLPQLRSVTAQQISDAAMRE
jgi:sugar lactone lactonase YvrE